MKNIKEIIKDNDQFIISDNKKVGEQIIDITYFLTDIGHKNLIDYEIGNDYIFELFSINEINLNLDNYYDYRNKMYIDHIVPNTWIHLKRKYVYGEKELIKLKKSLLRYLNVFVGNDHYIKEYKRNGYITIEKKPTDKVKVLTDKYNGYDIILRKPKSYQLGNFNMLTIRYNNKEYLINNGDEYLRGYPDIFIMGKQL